MNTIAVIVSFAVLATASAGIVGAPVAVAPAPVVGTVAIAPQPLVRTVAIAQQPLIAQPAFRLAPPAFGGQFIQPGFGAVRLAPQGFGGFGFPQYGAVGLAQTAYRPVAAASPYGLGYARYY